MKVYKSNEINKKFTDIINDYVSQGYTINTNTMSGSQGEICKIHLLSPDDSHILNIRLESFYKISVDGVKIIITKVDNKERKFSRALDTWVTLWNNDGEEVLTEVFYELSSRDHTVYCDEEYYNSIKDKKRMRLENKYSKNYTKKTLSSKAHEIVLSYIKRQPKCKCAKLSDISKVLYNYSSNTYEIFFKNKVLYLHA